MNDRVMEEMSNEIEQKEKRNQYKYRLLTEYRDITDKITRLELKIRELNNTCKNEKEAKHVELLKKQIEIMFQYQDVLSARLRLLLED